MTETLNQPDEATLRAVAEFADDLARAAALETLPRFRAGLEAENKRGHGYDPVTDADREAERRMRALIAARFPSHGIVGEEFEETPADGPWTWTLDPVDGTRSFVAGVPVWTTLIALSFEGRAVLGVIDQPFTGERWTGFGDTAVYRRGDVRTPCRVRRPVALTDAIVMATTPEMFDPAELAAFQLVSGAARLTRFGADAYAYGLLALGQVDLVIESSLKPYDIRAHIPIVRAAGGAITDWTGRAEPHDGGQVLAAGDPEAAAEALVALRRSAHPGVRA